MNIDELKNEYAKSKGYDSWAKLRNCFTMNPFDMGIHENKCIEYCIELKNNGVLADVRSSHIEDIRKELEVFFASRKISHRNIKKFELEKSGSTGINIIPKEPYFEESYEDEDADILIEAIGKKYGVNGFGWIYWVYPK